MLTIEKIIEEAAKGMAASEVGSAFTPADLFINGLIAGLRRNNLFSTEQNHTEFQHIREEWRSALRKIEEEVLAYHVQIKHSDMVRQAAQKLI